MKRASFTVSLEKNPSISVEVIAGHFTSSQKHFTHYLDLSNLKTNSARAREVAVELALPYLTTTQVDTIVCLEGTEVIGAYMAEELSQDGTLIVNSDSEINVVTPLMSVDRKLIFQSSTEEFIYNKNVVLLLSSLSSGTKMRCAVECIAYYGGILTGISTLFNAEPEKHKEEIHSMFTREDIPGYQIFAPRNCDLCKEGRKLDALVINNGYIDVKG